MELTDKLKKLLSLTRRAVQDYDMIQDGDRVCVGLSGGKDSSALLAVLAWRQPVFLLLSPLYCLMPVEVEPD